MRKKLKLILPNKKYVSSFAKGMEEFRSEKKKSRPTESTLKYFKSVKDFPVYQKKMTDDRKGTDLPKGRVPSTAYWAMVGNKFVGILKLRHRLNKKLLKMGGHIGYAVVPSERRKGYATQMLRLALKRAKALGIEKALLTCDQSNIVSRKVIEKNGGILLNKIKAEGVIKLRFWVPA